MVSVEYIQRGHSWVRPWLGRFSDYLVVWFDIQQVQGIQNQDLPWLWSWFHDAYKNLQLCRGGLISQTLACKYRQQQLSMIYDDTTIYRYTTCTYSIVSLYTYIVRSCIDRHPFQSIEMKWLTFITLRQGQQFWLIGDWTYNSFQDLVGYVFLQLTHVFVACNMLTVEATRNSKICSHEATLRLPLGAVQRVLVSWIACVAWIRMGLRAGCLKRHSRSNSKSSLV